MSFTIRLSPGGRQFQADAHETVLEAALRSGINLPYSCAGGSCGECRARLISGRLGPTEFHDFNFSEAEKLQGFVLLCSIRPASDLVVEAAEFAGADIPHQQIEARISGLEIRQDYLLLSLRTPRSRTLRFLAGQFVELAVEGVGRRPAAIASCPCNGMILQLHLSRGHGDPLTEHLFSNARVGEPVGIEGPFGRFTLDERVARPLVMVAEGTGFAPVKSLIEHVIALDWPKEVQLFWLAKPGGHYLANQCRAWQDALDGFTYTLLEAVSGDPAATVCEAARPGADWYVAAGDAFAERLVAGLTDHERLFRYPGC